MTVFLDDCWPHGRLDRLDRLDRLGRLGRLAQWAMQTLHSGSPWMLSLVALSHSVMCWCQRMGLLPASRILRVVAGRLVAAWLPVAGQVLEVGTTDEGGPSVESVEDADEPVVVLAVVPAAEPAAVDAELACTAGSQVH